MGFTDYHAHILPGLDDGARDVQESLRIAGALASAGFRTVHCTPHRLVGAFEAVPDQIREQTARLQTAIDAAAIPLKLLPGTEYYLDEFLLFNLQDPMPLGSTGLLLVEAPLQAVPPSAEQVLAKVTATGLTPLVAHPERCQLFFGVGSGGRARSSGLRERLGGLLSGRGPRGTGDEPDTALIGRLQALGCRFQGDIGSFAGDFGEEVRRRAMRLLSLGVFTHLGSDAHRANGLAETLQRGMAAIEAVVGGKALRHLLR